MARPYQECQVKYLYIYGKQGFMNRPPLPEGSVAYPSHFGTDSDVDPGGPKTYGSGSGTLVHLHHSLKIKIHKEVTKKQKSRFFKLFLLDDGKGSYGS